MAKKAPAAGGDTLRDGALIYGNFTEWTNTPMDDAAFKQMIEGAVGSFDGEGTATVSDILRWESNYIQPDSRDEYLQGTRYEGGTGQVASRGDALRSPQGDRRAWIEDAARQALERRDAWVRESPSARKRQRRDREVLAEKVELTRFRGHIILCVQGVANVQSTTAIPGGIPTADG